MSDLQSAAAQPLPKKCCFKCVHALENVMGMGPPGALFCTLNPPSIALQVRTTSLALASPPKPGDAGLIYMQPMVQPGNVCSYFVDRECPIPLFPSDTGV